MGSEKIDDIATMKSIMISLKVDLINHLLLVTYEN